MTKAEKDEAERIAMELLKVDRDFKRTGQAGLNVDGMEGLLLAKAVQAFQAKAEAMPLSSVARRQREIEAAL